MNVDPQTPHGKPDMTVMFQDLMEAVSAAGQCLFTTYAFFPPPLIRKPHAWYTKAFCRAVPVIGPVLRLLNKFPGIMCFNIPVIFNQSKALRYATGMPELRQLLQGRQARIYSGTPHQCTVRHQTQGRLAARQADRRAADPRQCRLAGRDLAALSGHRGLPAGQLAPFLVCRN